MEAEKSNAAKEFLKQVRLCDIHINNKLEEKARLQALALKITSSWLSEHVSGSGERDKLGDAVSRIMDLESEIDRDIDIFVQQKRSVQEVIDIVSNPDQLNILYKRYVHYESFEQIANEMCMSYRNVCTIHGKALQAVNEILQKS